MKKKDPKRGRRRTSKSFLVARNTGLERLQQRVQKASDYLKQRLGRLTDLRQQRDEELIVRREAIVDARVQRDKADVTRVNLLGEAEGLEEDARTLMERVVDLRTQADATPVEERNIDIVVAEGELKAAIGAWRVRFKCEQDGKTRRKRRELARDLERLEQRKAEQEARNKAKDLTASGISMLGQGLEDRGTGDPNLGRLVKTQIIKQPEAENDNGKAIEDGKGSGHDGAEQGAGAVAGDEQRPGESDVVGSVQDND